MVSNPDSQTLGFNLWKLGFERRFEIVKLRFKKKVPGRSGSNQVWNCKQQ